MPAGNASMRLVSKQRFASSDGCMSLLNAGSKQCMQLPMSHYLNGCASHLAVEAIQSERTFKDCVASRCHTWIKYSQCIVRYVLSTCIFSL